MDRITIEVKSTIFTKFPIFVEIVPLNDDNPCTPVGPGYVVMTSYGGHGCNPRETVNVNLPAIVEIGSLYAVQIFFFDGGLVSAARDCIHVTPDGAPVETITWSQIKRLFQ